jgi:hypothetical protein
MKIRGLSLGAITELALASTRPLPTGPRHVFLCIADHYEPMWHSASLAVERERVARWVNDYPRAMERFADVRGRRPQHTFFYPADPDQRARTPEHIAHLSKLCHAGWGDVEIHLHHDKDAAANLAETLTWFKEHLHDEHGLLAKDDRGEITYGFIHGNWALCNSRPDGRWCGVNEELTVLRNTGCYADFTLPAAPDPAQTRTVNSIYYAFDQSPRPRSHDVGQRARVGVPPARDGLLLIQGPTMLDWSRRRHGLLPRLENANLDARMPPSLERLEHWLRAGVHVAGRPDWLFVKLHTHGAPEPNSNMLLGEPMQAFHAALARLNQADPEFNYYYVTAREMAALVHEAERGPAIFALPKPIEPSKSYSFHAAEATS